MTDALETAASLSFWRGPVQPEPLSGGITNTNFVVTDAGKRYVVRIGFDIAEHQIVRSNELAASRAAAAAGISPQVVHAEPGAMVLEFVEGDTLDEADVRDPSRLERLLPVISKCHQDIPQHFRGPAMLFWVFHILRNYAETLKQGQSAHRAMLTELSKKSDTLQDAVGPIDLVFGHNDLLAANFIDSGDKIWLIDWDYAGFNSPLFDLGGLASNNGFSEAQEDWLLENYYECTVDDELRRRFEAMKCASLLRETMWSMVSELHSDIDFDYAAYTAENLRKFNTSFDRYYARWDAK
ncbi:MAG: phosphotransferase family protein [Hyphomicrobiales bacterium]|nr:phosphotransferase family protein [Hyphomicrobiales bacterium]MCP4999694.1 phosphotransferase family protein [Hyphomicrobiales bacterium]